MKRVFIISILFLFNIGVVVCAQNASQEERLKAIESQLNQLSVTMPGLNESIELSVSDLDIQDFIRAIANANKINVHISPDLNMRISNNFSNVTVSTILLFLCKQYNLNLDFYNNIISISRFTQKEKDPTPIRPKELNVKYNTATQLLSMDLNNDTLSKVSKEITKLSGKNIVFAPEIGNLPISFYIENMELTNAIDKMAMTNGLVSSPTDDNCILIEKQNTIQQSSSSSSYSSDYRSKKSKNRKTGIDYTIEGDKISLTANDVEINDLINEVSSELKTNYVVYSQLQGKITINLSNVTYEEFLAKVLNGSNYTAQKNGNIYMIGEKQTENIRETRVIQLQYRSIDKIIDFIPKNLQKEATVTEFPELNSVIVSGSKNSIDEIESFLNEIDKVVPVILIEVIMVSSNVYKRVSTGINFGSGNAPSSSSLQVNGGIVTTLSSTVLNDIISGINRWGSFFNLGKVNSSFYLSLSALEDQGVVKIHSTPKLATLNSHEATLVVGETEYYKEVQNTIVGNENPQNIQSFEWKSIDANLSISIKPMYSGDDQITMDIKVAQSGFKESAGKDAPPGSENKTFSSIMRVRNEEMILLGGLEENVSSNTGSGLPLLSRIPVIKWFFSNRSKKKEDSQLNIFIRPTILF
ncbi:MAG: secretin and TonB N-terminal domain-containing protein [Paludibacteraceae bacterium]|nr:secretin and TonB N-terminal domain-containing protein [Paludibacteraceae bacterium]